MLRACLLEVRILHSRPSGVSSTDRATDFVKMSLVNKLTLLFSSNRQI
nr:MAG TPA: hypothetical protein [Bacteriophage sp.]